MGEGCTYLSFQMTRIALMNDDEATDELQIALFNEVLFAVSNVCVRYCVESHSYADMDLHIHIFLIG